MSNAGTPGRDVDIDLARLALAIWERRILVVTAALLVGAAAFVIASGMPSLYRAESRVLIEARQSIATGDQTQRAPEAILDQQGIASQVEVMRSTDLLRQVAGDLDLAGRPEFDPAARPSALRDLLVLIGLSGNPLENSSEERVLRTMREKLQVYLVQSSRVIAIEFSSEDPELAAAVPNAIADVYLTMQSGVKLETNADATAWLEPEIALLRERVREAEAKVAAFRAESGLFLVGDTNTIAAQQLSELSSELSRVRAERADSEARAENVRTALEEGRSTDTLSSVLDSDLIQRLRERQIGTQSEIADLSITLLDNHPRIRGLRSQLADLDRQIQNEIRKALASLESDASVARLREVDLARQLETLKADSARAGGDEVELRALEREATAERQLLETYLARFREAASRTDSNALPADARIISRATVPGESYFPKTVPIVIVSVLATLLLVSIFIMLSELFSGRALRPAAGFIRDDEETIEPVESNRLIAIDRAATEATLDDAAEDFVVSAHSEPVWVARYDAGKPAVEDVAVDDNGIDKAQPVKMAVAMPVAAPLVVEEPPVDQPIADEVIFENPIADEPVAETPDDDFSVAAVAAKLAAGRAPIAVCVSPEGDEASAGAVMLARTCSENGRRALLVDMTGSAFPTELMAERAHLPGITDLLCAEVSIAEAIHADRLSSADLIPQGNADPALAMRGASRIAMIVEALSNAYDIVIVECGQTDIASVQRIVGNLDFTLVLSFVEPDETLIGEELKSFFDAGHHDPLLLAVGDRRARLYGDETAA